MTNTLIVRRLGVDDVASWKEIRQAALETAPRAFGRTLASYQNQSDDDHAARLSGSAVFGAFSTGKIIGSAVWLAESMVTDCHRGWISNFFVLPDWQGRGVADALMDAIVQDATGQVLQLELSVAVGVANRALAFYQRRGFAIIGTIPRASCHDGIYTDEHLMILRMDA